MLTAIVGVEVPIEEIENKSNLSQNRTVADHTALIMGLRRAEDPNSQSIVIIMADLD